MGLKGGVPITEPMSMKGFPLLSAILGIITGMILGVIYSRLFPCIPGKSLRKAICYGLLVWVMKDIVVSTVMISVYGAYYMAFDILVIGLPRLLVYGSVLGKIYERIK